MTSPFAIRGVIEGFYGAPWSHAERLDMIDFIAGLGMNAFVYAPKDDLLLRRDWRELYDGNALRNLAELAERCVLRDITFTFALSPGLSMRYSNSDDFDRLIAKFAQVRSLGVTSFSLLLDDIPGQLQHPQDVERFPSLVAAQIELVSHLHRALGEQGPTALMVAPTQYWGKGDEAYITELGRGLANGIEILWTGRAICSAELDAADARRFTEATGHRPLYWDNFPVNDVAMTHELHIGPYSGREPGIAEWSSGIILNGMPFAESSKIGFATAADFLADPNGFEQESSWNDAVALVAGNDAELVRAFADAFRGSPLCTDDSPRLGDKLSRFTFDHEFGDAERAVSDLVGVVDALTAVGDAMPNIANSKLATEIAPWITQYQRAAAALAQCAEFYAAGPIDSAARAAVMASLTELRSHRLRVHGDLVDMFLSDFAHEFQLG